jgi:hypothetical protein
MYWNATKHYQPRHMHVGTSSKILHQMVCGAPPLSTAGAWQNEHIGGGWGGGGLVAILMCSVVRAPVRIPVLRIP